MYHYYQELSEKEQTAEKEDRYTGTVTWKVYFEFWKAGAGIPMLIVLIILTLGTQVNQGTWLIWQSVTCRTLSGPHQWISKTAIL